MHLSESARRTWESRPKAIIDRLMFGVRRCLCIYKLRGSYLLSSRLNLPKQCHNLPPPPPPHPKSRAQTLFNYRLVNATPTSTPLHHPLPRLLHPLQTSTSPSNPPPSTSPTPRQTPSHTEHNPNPKLHGDKRSPFSLPPPPPPFHHIVQFECAYECEQRRTIQYLLLILRNTEKGTKRE